MALGKHRIEYEVLEGWDRLPEGWSYIEVAGVACDSKDRVYVFNRGKYPVVVFDKEGKFLNAWGEGVFKGPHGIFIDRHDNLWLADDKDHTVHKFTPDGKKLMTLGESGKAADTGYKIGASPVLRAAGPFHRVTNVAVLPDGDMYIADGYGNARVHKFSKDGKLLFSWGEPGRGPGQFILPHGIGVDSAGLVYVADRENSRVQIFSPKGEYLREWKFPTTSSSTTRTCCTSPRAASSTT
jgi:DNA-binding beta-propeller fold protein YncE